MDKIPADKVAKELAKKAYPDYRGRKIFIEPQTYPLDIRSYWDGGSRSYFKFVRLEDGRVSQEMPAQSGFDRPIAGADSVMLPDGIVCIEHIYFCGRDLGLRIHVNPNNLIKFLPAVNNEAI